MNRTMLTRIVCLAVCGVVAAAGGLIAAEQKPDMEKATYMPVVMEKSFQEMMEMDGAAKAKYVKRQRQLLERRYDLSDKPSEDMMSAGRKAIQRGVRVKLPDGLSWKELSEMSPQAIKERDLFPLGFRPLPHSKHSTGGQVFPQEQIDAMQKFEDRNLERFDTKFDIPTHFTPEFPPPIYLTSRPDLGDVSKGKVLSIKNYYDIFHGILTPVQMEGMRLLLTPFPQQQFNQTYDRKVKEPSLGVTCLDCHVNGHTNAAFHLNPDTRPQAARL